MIYYIGLFGIFKKTLDTLAKKTGFIKRQNILTALDFLLVMTVGQSCPHEDGDRYETSITGSYG